MYWQMCCRNLIKKFLTNLQVSLQTRQWVRHAHQGTFEGKVRLSPERFIRYCQRHRLMYQEIMDQDFLHSRCLTIARACVRRALRSRSSSVTITSPSSVNEAPWSRVRFTEEADVCFLACRRLSSLGFPDLGGNFKVMSPKRASGLSRVSGITNTSHLALPVSSLKAR